MSEEAEDNTIEDPVSVGPSPSRRRTTSSGSEVQLVFELTAAQVPIWWAFFENDLKDGILPYRWAHPLTGIVHTWKLKKKQRPKVVTVSYNQNKLSLTLLRFA